MMVFKIKVFRMTFLLYVLIKKNLIGNGCLIPAGPLRENLKSLNRYKNIFLNGTNENR